MFAARVEPTTAMTAAAAIPSIVFDEDFFARVRERVGRCGASSNFKISILCFLLMLKGFGSVSGP
jgi:hypothetical protein